LRQGGGGGAVAQDGHFNPTLVRLRHD